MDYEQTGGNGAQEWSNGPEVGIGEIRDIRWPDGAPNQGFNDGDADDSPSYPSSPDFTRN